MKIGLVLSGGGVLGVAHISVLKELEANNIKISAISGCSSGAIIGALYADGGILRIEAFLRDLEDAGLFAKRNIKFALPDKVFDQIRQSLRKNLRSKKFYDLSVDYCCTATDLIAGKAISLHDGDLVDSIMASASYPGVFQAQEIGGKILIDGGVTNNLPVLPIKNKTDFIIGSSLHKVQSLEKLDTVKKLSRLAVTLRSIDLMQQELAEIAAKDCDFVFYPPIEEFNWYNFDKIFEIEKISDQYAGDRIKELKKVISGTMRKKKGFWSDLFTGR